MTMRDTPETLAWLKKQHTSGSRAWPGLCQKLARSARDLPARYPSAIASQLATPQEDRVYKRSEVRAGMVAYFDDPNDSNPYGHIVTVNHLLKGEGGHFATWTNDARVSGGVDLVRETFFPDNWGDTFQFAATSLNGFDLLLGKPSEKVPPLHEKGAKKIKRMINELEGMIEWHKKAGHPRLVKALQRDIVHLKKILDRFNK